MKELIDFTSVIYLDRVPHCTAEPQHYLLICCSTQSSVLHLAAVGLQQGLTWLVLHNIAAKNYLTYKCIGLRQHFVWTTMEKIDMDKRILNIHSK